MLATSKRLRVHVRWMIKRDLPEVVKIENGNSQLPSPIGKWSKRDFLAILNDRTNVGMVAECGEKVVGFFVYNLQPDKFHIYNLAVDKGYENQGVGAQLVEKLKGKLSKRRRVLEIDIREYNLHAQLFLKKCGFLAVETMPGWYEEPRKEDAYKFRFTME